MNYYSHNIGDYAQATMHLSLVEDAIYSRLLRRYYAEEQPIKDDLHQICRWVGARTEDERAAVALVLSEFFTLTDGFWCNKRADAEIAAYHVKAETAKANGKRGGRPRKDDGNPEKPSRLSVGSDNEPNPNPVETGSKANQETRTKNQEPEDQEQCAASAPPAPEESKATTKKRGSRLPDDWTLSPELAAWAKSERPELDDRMVRAMADSFRDFWTSKTGKDATKLDWAATWRNWVRNQRITGGGQRAGPARPSSHLNLDHIDHEEGLERQPDGSYRIARNQA